jgi:hypothetical protein
MEEFDSEQSQEPPPVIEKPTSVTVFGILNCVFGGLGLLCMPCAVFGFLWAGKASQIEITPEYKIWSLFGLFVGFVFCVWELKLGIGLVTFKYWARRGTVIFAWSSIIWLIFGIGINIIAMRLGWVEQPQNNPAAQIGIVFGYAFAFLYPALLVIFMQSEKVRRAFAAIGG